MEAIAWDSKLEVTPRLYQLEILEAALKQNTLAFLGTGSGKTMIAVLFIKFRLAVIKSRESKERRKQIIAFLAPTKLLVEQQRRYIQGNCDCLIRSFTGESSCSKFSISDWSTMLESLNVMVITPEIFRHILQHGLIHPSVFDSVIVDECHHAFGKDPMAICCELLQSVDPIDQPRMFAMTASPIPCKKGSVRSKIQTLEATLRCRLACPRHELSVKELREKNPKPLFKLLHYSVSNSHFFLSGKSFDEFLKPPTGQSASFSCTFPVASVRSLQHAYQRLRHSLYLVDIRRILRDLKISASELPQLSGLFVEQFKRKRSKSNRRMNQVASTVDESSMELADAPLIEEIGSNPQPGSTNTAQTEKGDQRQRRHLPRKSVSEILQILGQTIQVSSQCGAIAAIEALRISMMSNMDLGSEDTDSFLVSKQSRRTTVDLSRIEMMKEEIMTGPFSSTSISNAIQMASYSLLDVFSCLAACAGPTICKRVLTSFQETLAHESPEVEILVCVMKILASSDSDIEVVVGSAGVFQWLSISQEGFSSGCDSLLENGDINLQELCLAIHSLCSLFSTSFLPSEIKELLQSDSTIFNLVPFDSESVFPTPSDPLSLVQCFPPSESTLSSMPLISLKVKALFSFLLSLETSQDEDQSVNSRDGWACIIFCQMRLSAMTLCRLLERVLAITELPSHHCLGTSPSHYPHHKRISPHYLVGGRKQVDQVLTLLSFKAGKFNTLFATDVAEEGIDVRACKLVVNFDLPRTVKSFIQRRGRARAEGSLMVAMLADNIGLHCDEIQDLIAFQQQEDLMTSHDQLGGEKVGKISTMQELFESIFSSEESEGMYFQSSAENELEQCDEGTAVGSIVNCKSSIKIVETYCKSLKSDQYYQPKPLFWITSSVLDGIKMFRCSILLPSAVSPRLRCITSDLCSSKQAAKSDVSLKCVKQLRDANELDQNLVPNFPSSSDLKNDACLERATVQCSDPSPSSIGLFQLPEMDTGCISISVQTVPRFPTLEESLIPPLVQVSVYSILGTLSDRSCQQFQSYSSDEFRIRESITDNSFSLKASLHALNSVGFVCRQEIPLEVTGQTLPFLLRGKVPIDCCCTYVGSRMISSTMFNLMRKFHKLILFRQQVGWAGTEGLVDSTELSTSIDWCTLFPKMDEVLDVHSLLDAGFDDKWIAHLEQCCFEANALKENFLAFRSRVANNSDICPLPFPSASECDQEGRVAENPMRSGSKKYFKSKQNHVDLIEQVYGCQFNPTQLYVGVSSHSQKRLTDTFFVGPRPAVDQDKRQKVDLVSTPESSLDKSHEAIPEGDVDIPESKKRSFLACQSSSHRSFLEHFKMKRLVAESELEELARNADHRLTQSLMISPINSHFQLVDRVDCGYDDLQSLPLDNDDAPKNSNHKKIRESICHLIPEYCVSLGRSAWYYMGMLSPAIIYRIQGHMLSYELKVQFENLPLSADRSEDGPLSQYPFPINAPICLIQEALTARMAHDSFDSERLEWLGDIFLKFASTVEVYEKYPDAHEGFLSNKRVSYISNMNLLKLAKENGLSRFMRVLPLAEGSQQLFAVFPGYFQSVGADSFGTEWQTKMASLTVKAKAVSDFLEAIIGCYFVHGKYIDVFLCFVLFLCVESGGMAGGLFALFRLGIFTTHPAPIFREILLSCNIFESILAILGSGKVIGLEAVESVSMVSDDVGVDVPDAGEMVGEGRKFDCSAVEATSLPLLQRKSYIDELFIPPEFPDILARIALGPDMDMNRPVSLAFLRGEDEGTSYVHDAMPIDKFRLDSRRLEETSYSFTELILSSTRDCIECRLGYRFRSMALLEEAVTHSSVAHKRSNQRLEFLGDAVLDLVVGRYLFDSHPHASPGKLSLTKSKLVSNENLGRLAFKLQLYKHLDVLSQALQSEFNDLQALQDCCSGTPPDNADESSHVWPENYTEMESISPALSGALADLMEALFGAMYLDCGGDLVELQRVARFANILPEE